MPKRIQRKRAKGWRAPEGTINCTRPGPYGNPFKIGCWYCKGDYLHPREKGGPIYTEVAESIARNSTRCVKIVTAEQSIEWYRWYLSATNIYAQIKRDLAGHDLMCFCALGDPCHVDVLLEIANS